MQRDGDTRTSLGGMPNCTGPLENGLSISYTVKHGVIMSPRTANPRYFLEKWKHTATHKKSVYSSFICDNQKQEITQISFCGWLDAQAMVRPSSGTPLSNEKEQPVSTHNLEESQRYSADWEKGVSEGDMLYNSICSTFLKRQKCADKEQISGSQGLWVGWGCDTEGTAWGSIGSRNCVPPGAMQIDAYMCEKSELYTKRKLSV